MACRRSCSGFDDYLLTRTPLHHTVVFPRDTVCLSCDRTFGVTQGHMGRLMRGPCPGSDCVPDAGLGDAAHDPRPSQGGSVLRSPCQIGSHRPSPHRMPPLQVYIIGGLVDECVLENLTRDASEQVCPHIPPRVDPPPPSALQRSHARFLRLLGSRRELLVPLIHCLRCDCAHPALLTPSESRWTYTDSWELQRRGCQSQSTPCSSSTVRDHLCSLPTRSDDRHTYVLSAIGNTMSMST